MIRTKRDVSMPGMQKRRTPAWPRSIMVLCALSVLSCAPQKEPGFVITAPHTTSAMTIDGRLDEAVWQRSAPVVLRNNRTGAVVDDARIATQALTCHDDSTLYFAFICQDPDIWSSFARRDDHLWNEEAVEVFIDADDRPDTYVEIELSPANVLFDSYIVDPQHIDFAATAAFDLPGIRTAVVLDGTLNQREDTDAGGRAEIAIPFRDLATERAPKITTATKFRINFYRLDKNRGMESSSQAWSPTGGRFHKPSVFGRLIFKR